MTSSADFELSVTLGRASFSGSGEPERVMAAFDKFTDLLNTTPLPADDDDGQEDTTETHDKLKGGTPGTGRKVVLPVFLDEVKPKGNALITTAIVAWSEIHDGKPQLTPPEVKALWKRTPMKAPGNTPRDMASAEKAGFLEKQGTAYSVTGHGKKSLGLPTH